VILPDLFSRFRDIPEPPRDEEDTQTNPPLTLRLSLLQEAIAALTPLTDKVAEVEEHLARLAREQFKANTLTENALGVAKAALARTSPEQSPAVESASQVMPPIPNLRLLEAIMPILDSIEAALASGQTQCDQMADERAREILMGWLEGQRLLRDRLLALFDKENVRPIESIGQVFDPYRHVAVETVYDPLRATGTIIEERRRGYETDQRVLRFAQVIVTTNQPA
jgi:molecular chaperone GrpE (heat shock protein)